MNGFFKAIEQRRFKQARLLLDMEVNLNTKSVDGKTALIHLCYLEPESMAVRFARLLMEREAEVGLTDNNGLSALSHAILQEKERLTKLFLTTAGDEFDINARDRNGRTPLFHAATVGNFDILKLLIKELRKYRLNVDIADIHGVTPLIQASKKGHLLCARYLISEGKASKYIRDKKCFKTAEEWEQTKESICYQKQSALFKSLFESNYGNEDEKSSLDTRAKSAQISRKIVKNKNRIIQDPLRPKTAPAILENTNNSCEKPVRRPESQKEELAKVFRLYQCHLSESFRPGCKPVEANMSEDTEESETKDSDSEESSDLSVQTKWNYLLTHRRRGSLFKSGNQTKLPRRGSLAPASLNAFSGRRLSQSYPSPISQRRASVSPEMLRAQSPSRSSGGLSRSRSDLSTSKLPIGGLFVPGRRQSLSSSAINKKQFAPHFNQPVKRSSDELPTLSVSLVIEEESENES